MLRNLFHGMLGMAIGGSFLLFSPEVFESNGVAGPPSGVQHHMDMPAADEKCAPIFTYEEGPNGPSRWGGVCRTGKLQSPIDIRGAEKMGIPAIVVNYKSSDVQVKNDCNHYRIQVKFPGTDWLKFGKKPFFLSEISFHQPGENAVGGKRPRMSIDLVHLSAEANFLIVEIPVVAGKENSVIKTLWEHIPEKGMGHMAMADSLKINAADLLPVDHSYYRYNGSLTTPICNEDVTWYVMKNPIEMSEAQIAEYAKHYHDTARPLQPLNGRPVAESQ